MSEFMRPGTGGWRPLFNGKSTSMAGRHVGPGRFVIENGVLRTEGGMGLLWYTREKFGDATMRVVFIPAEPKGSRKRRRLHTHSRREPTEPWMPVNKGYEVQIDENGDDFHRTGVLYSFTKAKAKPELREWNTMEIMLDGDRTTVSSSTAPS